MKVYYNGIKATLPTLNKCVEADRKEILTLCTKGKSRCSYRRLEYNLLLDTMHNYISSDRFVEVLLLNCERYIPEVFNTNLNLRTLRMLLSGLVSNRNHINYLLNKIVTTNDNYDIDYIIPELIFTILNNLSKALYKYVDSLGGVLCV